MQRSVGNLLGEGVVNKSLKGLSLETKNTQNHKNGRLGLNE